jgi:hypothetical protein
MSEFQGLLFWGFLIVFGVVMYVVAPRSKDEAGIFGATTRAVVRRRNGP